MIYPPRCPICDEIVEDVERRIHKKCEERLVKIEGATCMQCGRPLMTECAEYCFDCARKKRCGSGVTYEQGKSLILYQGPMKKSMYRFKYANKREYSQYYAQLAVDLVGEWMMERQIETIVPVPMFSKKQRQRGYNQAEVFAKALSRRIGIPANMKLVRRVRNTTPMKELDDVERKNNLKNAFQIQQFIVKYKRILLVDDIYTTGSTVGEVSRVLKEAGVEKIYVLSICMGQGI